MTDTDYVLDSNILVYAFDASDKRKHDIAEQLLSDAVEGGSAACMQNLAEFFYTVTRKLSDNLTIEEARNIIDLILNCKSVKKLQYGSAALSGAMRMSAHMHFWDALLSATMIENNIFTIYTENIKDFKDFRIKAINPFKS